MVKVLTRVASYKISTNFELKLCFAKQHISEDLFFFFYAQQNYYTYSFTASSSFFVSVTVANWWPILDFSFGRAT